MSFLSVNRFRRNEDGSMVPAGLVFLIAVLVLGGIGLDVNNAIRVRAELQATADATAHAALYLRSKSTASAAKAAALDLAKSNSPPSRNGDVLTASDITFGVWNAATQTFTPDTNSKTAVRVDTQRLAANRNALETYLLRLVGVSSFDIRNRAIYETYQPPCLREGFVSDKIIDLQSNNLFARGFCLHANDHVELQNANTFQQDVIVSMPDKATIVTPDPTYESNPGLAAALRDGAYSIRILNLLPAIIEDLRTGGNVYAPSYVTPNNVINLSAGGLDPSDFTKGRIHYVGCSGNQTLRLRANAIYEKFVLVTNCKVQFPAQAEFYDVTLATTNTEADSISTAAKLVVGKNDACADGGGSVFMTLGGIVIAAQMEMNGSKMIALKNINFTSLAYGFNGASLISGGNISGTTNMVFGFCGAGMDNNFELPYFRLAL